MYTYMFDWSNTQVQLHSLCLDLWVYQLQCLLCLLREGASTDTADIGLQVLSLLHPLPIKLLHLAVRLRCVHHSETVGA